MAHSVYELRRPPAGHHIGHLSIVFEGKAPANKDQWVADMAKRSTFAKEAHFNDAMVRHPALQGKQRKHVASKPGAIENISCQM